GHPDGEVGPVEALVAVDLRLVAAPPQRLLVGALEPASGERGTQRRAVHRVRGALRGDHHRRRRVRQHDRRPQSRAHRPCSRAAPRRGAARPGPPDAVGCPIAEDRHWVEQLLTGVDDPLRVLVNEGSRLWFGYDIHTGDSGRHVSDETLVETVSGLAEIALALSITVGWTRADPTTRQVIAALTPDPVQRWARDRQLSGMASLRGLGG